MATRLITPKQKQILLFLYKFRFLNSRQIQILIGHKTSRRIKGWLKDLTDKGYLGMKYEREKRSENTKPAIYYLTSKSVPILKDEEGCDFNFLKRFYREKGRKEQFIEHCLFIADFYLYLRSKKKEKEVLLFFTESYLQGFEYFQKIQPDAYLTLKQRGRTTRYLFNSFKPNTKARFIRNKIKAYLKYSRDYKWEAATDTPLPAILLSFPDETMRNHIFYYTRAKLSKSFDDKTKFFLTTKSTIQHPQYASDIWQKVE